MMASSSVVVGLAFVATCLTLVRWWEMHDLLSVEGALLLTDKGPGTVFVFATHYFFSVFVLCIVQTREPSILVHREGDAYARIAGLCCLCGLMVFTMVFFIFA